MLEVQVMTIVPLIRQLLTFSAPQSQEQLPPSWMMAGKRCREGSWVIAEEDWIYYAWRKMKSSKSAD